jgi:hypothetical protein
MVEKPAVRIWLRWCVAGTLALCSCGIFDPRSLTSEPPEIRGNPDLLNLAGIMAGTGEQFTQLQYEDLFDQVIEYEDMNSGRYLKSQLIQRLRQIPVQYNKIQVQWVPGEIWENTTNDTLILTGVTYKIFLNGASALDTVPDNSGSSTFVVAKTLAWHICRWRDYPAGSGKSFFAP